MREYYSFIRDIRDDGIILYRFETDLGKVYTVFFSKEHVLEASHKCPHMTKKGFMLGFLCDSGNKQRQDIKIPFTFKNIIDDFLEENGDDSVLLYNCDSSDGKQFERNKLFTKWLNNPSYNSQLINDVVEVELRVDKEVSITQFCGYIICLLYTSRCV